MYHRDVIAAVGRRLPHRTRRDVDEVVDLLIEVWSDQLAAGDEIVLPEIGRLWIEVQTLNASGALRDRGQLRRVYGRFRPTPAFKQRLEDTTHDQTPQT